MAETNGPKAATEGEASPLLGTSHVAPLTTETVWENARDFEDQPWWRRPSVSYALPCSG